MGLRTYINNVCDPFDSMKILSTELEESKKTLEKVKTEFDETFIESHMAGSKIKRLENEIEE
jgi:hypothetical protein